MNTNSYKIYKICQECGKIKAYNDHPLCLSCSRKKNHYLKGKKMSKVTKEKISKSVKKSLQTHHIDLDISNNNKNNLLKLSIKNHRHLHLWAYRYLVDTGQIKKYIKWFFKTLKNQETENLKNEKVKIKIIELQKEIKTLEKTIV